MQKAVSQPSSFVYCTMLLSCLCGVLVCMEAHLDQTLDTIGRCLDSVFDVFDQRFGLH